MSEMHTNTDTDADKYILNGVEFKPNEVIEIMTNFLNAQQSRVSRLKARIADLQDEILKAGLRQGNYIKELHTSQDRIAELEAEVTKGHELQDSYCDRIAELEATVETYKDIAESHVTALLNRIAELEAAQRWIPVSERLPVDKKHYMTIVMNCFDGSRGIYRMRYYGDGDWFSWASESNVVTHWKEEPELPEVQE